jgi:hypothetical protein
MTGKYRPVRRPRISFYETGRDRLLAHANKLFVNPTMVRRPISVRTIELLPPKPPVRDRALEERLLGWSGRPRAKALGLEARRLVKGYVRPLEPEDRLLKASLGKINAEVERLRSGDWGWLAALEHIRRIEADRSLKKPRLGQFDETMGFGRFNGTMGFGWFCRDVGFLDKRRADFNACISDPYWYGLVAERNLKRVERDRATLNSDTMRLRIDAVEQLRIDLWERWKPEGWKPAQYSWQTMATKLEAIESSAERNRLYERYRAGGANDRKPKKRFLEVPYSMANWSRLDDWQYYAGPDEVVDDEREQERDERKVEWKRSFRVPRQPTCLVEWAMHNHWGWFERGPVQSRWNGKPRLPPIKLSQGRASRCGRIRTYDLGALLAELERAVRKKKPIIDPALSDEDYRDRLHMWSKPPKEPREPEAAPALRKELRGTARPYRIIEILSPSDSGFYWRPGFPSFVRSEAEKTLAMKASQEQAILEKKFRRLATPYR